MDPSQHFATFRSDVVGVQYYHGLVGRGEYVLLRREPTNKWDSNAVQVCIFRSQSYAFDACESR